MNLFELSAKISADTKDYEKAVKNATKVSKSLKDIMERSATQSETNKNKIKVLAGEYSSAKAKVAVLTEAFNKAAKEEGVTAEKTQKLAKELQEAEKESSDLKGQLDELTKKSKNAGDGFSKLGSALGKGLKTAGKIGVAAVGAAAAGIAALTKSAVENYAEYEQLVGGVETLFEKSADAVKQYANEAYKSAGLSANEYMSTVTSFSASLLQSLGRGAQTDLDALKENLDEQYDATKKSWDDRIKLAKKFKQRNVDELISQRDAELKALKKTNEQRLADAVAANNKSVVTAETQALAADLANQAVIDMADNAAKMGTSMEMIQNAYAGFAKQNYTMLDNLKLGYGGTQSEMERLVKHAAEVDKSIDANSLSFDNIVKAIRVVQDEMGITGTAANEAMATISGSLSATKSAWSNLITAIGGGGDVKGAMNNLVESASAVFNNIIPVAEEALGNIGSVITDLAPVISTALPDLFSRVLPPLISAAVELVKSLATALPEILGSLIDAIVGSAPLLIDGIVVAFQAIVEMLPELIQQIADALPELVPQIIAGIAQMVVILVKNLPKILASLDSAFLGLFEGAWEGIKEVFSLDKIGEFFSGVWKGIQNAFGSVADWFKNIFSKAWQAVKNVFSTGGKIFDGIKDGIVNAFKAVVNGIIKGINKVIAMPFKGINKVLNTIQNVEIVGIRPFDWLTWRAPVPQIPLLYRGGVLKKGQVGLLEGNGAEAVVPLENNHKWISKVARDMAKATGGNSGNVYNIEINIEGAKYSDERSLAEAVAIEIQNMTDRRAAVYA